MSGKGHGKLSSWPHIQVAQCLWDLEDGAWDETDNSVFPLSPAPQENCLVKRSGKGKKMSLTVPAIRSKVPTKLKASQEKHGWQVEVILWLWIVITGPGLTFMRCFSCYIPQPCFLQTILNSLRKILFSRFPGDLWMECLVLDFRKASSSQPASLVYEHHPEGALLHLGFGAHDASASGPVAKLLVF